MGLKGKRKVSGMILCLREISIDFCRCRRVGESWQLLLGGSDALYSSHYRLTDYLYSTSHSQPAADSHVQVHMSTCPHRSCDPRGSCIQHIKTQFFHNDHAIWDTIYPHRSDLSGVHLAMLPYRFFIIDVREFNRRDYRD